ncbi:MAG: dihydrodipicolinate reductase C-terminal domain-containing protein [Alphaproteobacteria bacterium]|nr:dihydrodipicolinate reductase C-terminal domain-containing protein [Alphaproteobacteria bacterium]
MINIGLLGYSGRMGQMIAAEIAENVACALAGGAVQTMKPEYQAGGVLITTKVAEVIAASDVVMDFTLADATANHARLAAEHGKPLMCGTTGLDAPAHDALKQAAAKIPVLYAANTSLSLVVMKQITALAARLLPGYDVAILDEHHIMKKDAPSGTAKALGEAVIQGSGGKLKPDYASVRAGSIIGEHEVIFAGQGETIRLHHSVTDRRIFARGAVQAALWLHSKKPGLYGMEDVLSV